MSVALIIYTRRHAALAVTRYFSWVAVIALALSVLGVVDVSLTDLDGKMTVLKLKFLFTPFLCVSVFGMLVIYSGRGGLVTTTRMVLLSIVPVLSVFLAQTSGWHDLFFLDPVLRGTGPFTVSYEHGLLFQLYMVYSNLLILSSILLLLEHMRRGDRLYRKQALIIILAFIPPLSVDYLSGITAARSMNLDLSPVAIALSGTILFWGLYRYRVLDVKPVVREEVIDNMSDALVVVSPDDRVIDYNKATVDLLVEKGGKAIGLPLPESLPFGRQLQEMIAQGKTKGDVTISGEKATSYEASIMPVTVQGEDMARIVLLRDITERKDMEEELRTANSRLSTLSSITRHDLGNKLTAIEGYAILAQESKDPAQIDAYISRLRQVCSSANHLIVFAREYEKIGITAPGWFSVGDLFTHAVVQNNVGEVRATSKVNGVKVYADAMIEKVLYNLVENSLRHGKSVTTLMLDSRLEDDALVIEYSDDGVGVPPEQKERIFERGFGSHTGLGLFLSREILAITGIEIRETGQDGARFELQVPLGRYRYNN